MIDLINAYNIAENRLQVYRRISAGENKRREARIYVVFTLYRYVSHLEKVEGKHSRPIKFKATRRVRERERESASWRSQELLEQVGMNGVTH